MRVAFLGPAGTFSDEALAAAAADAAVERVASPTIFHAIDAVEQGDAARAFVPFENSIEGTVRSTLDALAFDADGVEIVGEYDHPIRNNLIARRSLALEEIEAVVSHPQANAQCAGFLRRELPGATVLAAASTSDAVRQVSVSEEPWAALGSAAAAEAFGCVILREGVEDAAGNVTRFVWLARIGVAAEQVIGDRPLRTTLVFSELGTDRPGVLVDALAEFSNRGVNMTRIESRPMRQGLGRYIFFLDVDDAAGEQPTIDAIEALRSKAETVRVLGRYPVGGPAPLEIAVS